MTTLPPETASEPVLPLTVGPLRRAAPAISPAVTGVEVARIFEAVPDLPAVAVTELGRPIGLIDRLGFVSRFATRYGRELHSGRSIRRLMDTDPLIVDTATGIAETGERLFRLKPKALHAGFIVTDEGMYAGVVTGIDLLTALSQTLAATNERLVRTQAELVRSEKMAALGGLVAGIAHEVNTPIGSALTAATAFAERAKRFAECCSGGTLKRSDLDRFTASALQASEYVEVNVRRAAELITGFKQVAADQTSDERRVFTLRHCIEDVAISLRPRLRKAGIVAETSVPDEREIDGWPGALSQIITNLVLNAAVHAFEGIENPRVAVEVDDGPDPDTTRIAVSDNGRGIPGEHLPRIFDPFFTTRRGRGGTGLGLHIVVNLMTARMGGTITVENLAEGGARFTLVFPNTAP